MTSIFLQAFEGTNTTIPVWFMRQAGRYLPGYQKIRARYTLEEMFHHPEIIAEVTCMPIDILKVDAAILFADILTLPSHMGFQIHFHKTEGPIIQNPIQTVAHLKQLHNVQDIPYLRKAIQLINEKLASCVPLIGFAGSPFTVLCYLLEGGSSTSFTKTFRFMAEHPAAFHQLMKVLTQNTISYLNLQKTAGVHAFQIFDTWAGILRETDYNQFVLPYIREIFQKVDLPSIYYLKNSAHLLSLMETCGADFLSVCHTVTLGENPVLNKTRKGIQGNLFNGLLSAPRPVIKDETLRVLQGARGHRKYIFNLSHGVFPDTRVDTLKLIVDQVHDFKRKHSNVE